MLALSICCSSNSCMLKTRITIMPERFSCVTALTTVDQALDDLEVRQCDRDQTEDTALNILPVEARV